MALGSFLRTADRGATSVEYALVVVVLVLAVIGGGKALGGALSARVDQQQSAVSVQP